MSLSPRTSLIVVTLGAALAPTCYRARIDLRELSPNAGGTAGEGATPPQQGFAGAGDFATSAGSSSASGGDAAAEGERTRSDNGGAGNAGAETGNAGAGGERNLPCEDTLDPLQEDCARFGLPLAATCHETTLAGWDGCIAGGCSVCVEMLADYPHYFDWHPCCQPNEGCGKQAPLPCNERCPAPTEHDKTRRCTGAGL